MGGGREAPGERIHVYLWLICFIVHQKLTQLHKANYAAIIKEKRKKKLFWITNDLVVVQSLSCIWLCDPMDCSMPGFSALHHLLELAQTHVHWANDAIQLSHPLLPSSPFFPASGAFPMSRLFTSGGQSIGASASASVLQVNIQGWFALELTDLISFQSKGLSRAFSSTTIWSHQFFGA